MEETTKEPISTITGSINYTIKEFADGSWGVEYESSPDNDIAVIAIAQDLCEVTVAQVSLNKKQIEVNPVSTPEDKAIRRVTRKHLNGIIEKGVSARTGLKAIADYLQPMIKDYKKSLENGKEN